MRSFVLCLGLGVGVFVAAGCNPPDPNLSSTDQLNVVMSPATHDFGAVQVTQSSAPVNFDVNPMPATNLGNSYDTVVSITEDCNDFSVAAPGLPADVIKTCILGPVGCGGATDDPTPSESLLPAVCCDGEYKNYSFAATFAPTIAATVSCVVNINLMSGVTKTLTLTGTGTPGPIHLAVSPTSLGFGDARRNVDSTAVPINVSNTGGLTMTVSSVSISTGFVIKSGPTGGYTVAGGGTQPYSVVCHPTALGPITGNFTIISDDPTTPTKNIPLSCNGTDSALDIVPSPVTLATTRVGEPVEQDIQLKNTGTASMSFEGVTLAGTDLVLVTTPTNGTIAPNGIKTARVRFTAVTKGMATGILATTYDGGQQRATTINAKALSTSMAMTPDGDVSFGAVCSGQSKTQSFTILANDEGSFHVTTLAAPASPFTVTNPTLPANVLGSGASMYTFDVAAAPTMPGLQTSSMTLTTDIPGGSPRTVNLSVDAVPAGVTPTPTMVDFGVEAINTTTLGQSITLSNCDNTTVAFSNARIEGTDAGEFTIVSAPPNPMVMGIGSVTWLVVMTTHGRGTKTAEFVVDYGGGTARVALTGEGQGDGNGSGSGSGSGSDDNPLGESSYYACSTGTAQGVVPIALALGFVARRRRRARR